MYKFYMKNGQAQFYERGVEIDGTVYGIHTDRDILRIKRSVVNNKFAETDDNFDMDTEIAKIQAYEHHILNSRHQNNCRRYRRKHLAVCRI